MLALRLSSKRVNMLGTYSTTNTSIDFILYIHVYVIQQIMNYLLSILGHLKQPPCLTNIHTLTIPERLVHIYTTSMILICCHIYSRLKFRYNLKTKGSFLVKLNKMSFYLFNFCVFFLFLVMIITIDHMYTYIIRL